MVWSRFWHGSARTLDRFRESTCASLLDGVRLEFYLVSRLRLCFGGRPFEGREALHRNDERSGGRGRKYGHALAKPITRRRCRRCTPFQDRVECRRLRQLRLGTICSFRRTQLNWSFKSEIATMCLMHWNLVASESIRRFA
jgi:hypothetical protein